MKNDKMLIIVPNDISFGVIESQMFGLATYYLRKFHVDMVMPERFKNVSLKRPCKFHYYSSYSDLRRILGSYDVVYFRSIKDFLRLFSLCRRLSITTLYDFRGLSSYETYFKNNRRVVFIILFLVEFVVYHLSDQIQCVSNNMRIFLNKKYGWRVVSVVPCMTKSSIRRQDQLEEVIKFVYVGGLTKWQKLSEIIVACEKIQLEIFSEFTFITNDPEKLENELNDSNIKNYRVLTGNNNYVLDTLKTQDYGFLFRDDEIFNRVASPIKYLEYLSCGVVPIITPYIGDYSMQTQKRGIGIIYDGDANHLVKEILRTIQEIGQMRDRIFHFSSAYTWSEYEFHES
jgi:glycosyltransferase involved in cell wall biosynthesis